MLPSDLDERFPPKRRHLPHGCCGNRDGECREADACYAYWRESSGEGQDTDDGHGIGKESGDAAE